MSSLEAIAEVERKFRPGQVIVQKSDGRRFILGDKYNHRFWLSSLDENNRINGLCRESATYIATQFEAEQASA
jgi:hypothetical protein